MEGESALDIKNWEIKIESTPKSPFLPKSDFS
jgi:hypothetical protein